MLSITYARSLQKFAAVVGILFGIATIVAGSRVLSGADPRYVVFRPLLIYNTLMGIAYIAAGITIWRSLVHGRNAAGTIFFLNLVVLVAIVVAYTTGSAVAADSVRAMTLRTVVWLVLVAMTAWSGRARSTA